jgi:ATP-dependent RNA helicase DBP3
MSGDAVSVPQDAGVVKGKGPFSVVMAPTRELALQIAAVLVEAGSKCGINCITIYGGVGKKEQVGLQNGTQ